MPRISTVLVLTTMALAAAPAAESAESAAPVAGGLTFTADTSRPEMSLFVPGETVQLRFEVKGLSAADAGLRLQLDTVDEHGRSIRQDELAVEPGADGTWVGTITAPAGRLGFYRVRAKLSNGVELPKLGSRAAGFLTYAVVPDPAKRPLYPSRETFFGMQGGFCPQVHVLPYLGIRWVLGGYTWRDAEPDRPGQFAAKLAAAAGQAKPERPRPAWQFNGQPWQTYPLPCLYFAPKWAVQPETAAYCTGTLTPDGEKAWADYCRAAATACAADHPDLEERVYQITWEPVYPWGFKGSDQALIRIYELAYPALHEADPRAVVVGPTGAGASRGDVEWNATLLRQGLGRYLDAFAIHPYHALPPERLGLVDRLRELKEVIRQSAGRDLELLGTEQGWPTGEDPAKELEQARGLIRQNLIMLGEGFRLNFGFYIVDFPTEPGYGYFHNLRPNIPWGPDRTSPKPVAAAYAFQSYLLEGHRSCGPIEWLGDTALGYAFERQDHVVLVLWDYGDAAREVTVPVGGERVTVYDWMGNGEPAAAPAGQLRLTLGPEPVYVEGVAPALWGRGARKPVELKASRVLACPGTTAAFEGEAGGTAGAEAADRLYAEVESRLGLAEPVPAQTLPRGQRQPFRVVIGVPADTAPGAYPVRVILADARGAVGVGGAMLQVRPPVVLGRVHPRFGPDGEPGLSVELRSASGDEAEGTLTVRLQGEPETTRTTPFRAPAQGGIELTVTWPDLEPSPAAVLTAHLGIEVNGYRSTETRPVNFTPVPAVAHAPALAGEDPAWDALGAIRLQGRQMLVRAPAEYRGSGDLAATVRLGWDAQALYLGAEVTDEVFVQDGVGFDTWKGDCLQLGFDLDPGQQREATGNLLAEAGTARRACELDFALTRNGPEVFRTITFDKSRLPVRLLTADEAKLSVVRHPGRVLYRAAVRWVTLGLSAAPQAGTRFGLALTVNDMDDPKQADPKALGLFGGITPIKEPRHFGVVVLTGSRAATAPAAAIAPGAARFEFPGVLGQAAKAGAAPLPFLGSTGAAIDAQDRLWTASGPQLFAFARSPEGDRDLSQTVDLPTWVTHLGTSWDGERLFLAGGDGKLYAFAPASGKPQLFGPLPTGTNVRSFTAVPANLTQGWARRAKVFVLNGDTVEALAGDGTPAGVVLRLSRPADASWWYCAVGLEPRSGDLLVGSYWPDSKVYRFDPAGQPVTTNGWPRGGHASVLTVLGDEAWLIDQGGTCRPLPPGEVRENQGLSLGGPGTMYASGLAREAAGGYWLATSQGLLLFDRRGRQAGERLGGVTGVRALALAADGTAVAAVENGQRLLRFSLDDGPRTPFPANANEPWRVAAGWTNRASALAWDGGRFAVLDEVGRQLWHFDPWHTGWKEETWAELTEPGTLDAPRALAVADTRLWVVAGTRLRELRRGPAPAWNDVVLPETPDPAAVVAMAAVDDSAFVLAWPDRLAAFRVAAAGPCTRLWQAEGFQALSGIAPCERGLVAADAKGQRLALLAADTGQVLAEVTADHVPGGMQPGPVAARGAWVLVADEAGKRWLRFRIRAGGG